MGEGVASLPQGRLGRGREAYQPGEEVPDGVLMGKPLFPKGVWGGEEGRSDPTDEVTGSEF